jgi:hypothetical protein
MYCNYCSFLTGLLSGLGEPTSCGISRELFMQKHLDTPRRPASRRCKNVYSHAPPYVFHVLVVSPTPTHSERWVIFLGIARWNQIFQNKNSKKNFFRKKVKFLFKNLLF